jgi:hypothetical protein
MLCSDYGLHTNVEYTKADFLISAGLFDILPTFRYTPHLLSSREFRVLVFKLRSSVRFEYLGTLRNPN